MQNTNPKQFRAELKDYLEMASKEPVRISRRSGDHFILLNEQEYARLQNEISSLQRRIVSMTDILHGKTQEWTNDAESRLNRFRK
ncbi:MAG: type II toxin-antitoxin system Phd/YefM family antitoxin [Bdellovibrionales bacterium]|nr:type II toxin-antitoxin system Phd/YefM family antitoxin [Bdellovibrionales bacterium]